MLYDELSCDIETFSLRFHEAGIGTIAFGIDQHNGTAFAVDYRPLAEPVDGIYGEQVLNPQVRHVLKKFFEAYQGKLTWHGSSFDLRTLIYQLWMMHPLDTEGLLMGVDVLPEDIYDILNHIISHFWWLDARK